MNPMSDNRAMLLTAAGTSAIAVVRLAGPSVANFLHDHFTGVARPGACVHGKLREGDDAIDDPVIVRSEDGSTADVNLHGGVWIVRRVLELARRDGFWIDDAAHTAVPLWAVDGRDVIEREVLASLPQARTELAVRMLLAQTTAWDSLRTDATGAINVGTRDKWRERLKSILDDRALSRLLEPPCVAIVGAANVGKSTLANQLFAQERSITADQPGTTRDWVGEFANLDGLAVMLLDTPGFRKTADPIERTAIQWAGEKVRQADLIVLVLDATRALEPEQSPLLAAYPDAMRVVNKTDGRRAWDDAFLPSVIKTVATVGMGIDQLREAVHMYFGCSEMDLREPRCWTERQRKLLRAAAEDPTVLAAEGV